MNIKVHMNDRSAVSIKEHWIKNYRLRTITERNIYDVLEYKDEWKATHGYRFTMNGGSPHHSIMHPIITTIANDLQL